jgi:hypothetical protein
MEPDKCSRCEKLEQELEKLQSKYDELEQMLEEAQYEAMGEDL